MITKKQIWWLSFLSASIFLIGMACLSWQPELLVATFSMLGFDNVECVASGPMGGDAEIAAMVTRNEIDLVIFFRDPLGKHAHDVDISMLMRVCDVHDCPLATNYKSAHIAVKYFKKK